jgi:hypothetical protein
LRNWNETLSIDCWIPIIILPPELGIGLIATKPKRKQEEKWEEISSQSKQGYGRYEIVDLRDWMNR